MDHQTKNKEHKQLSQEMEMGLKRVMLVAGVGQRLLGKVAIVTGELDLPFQAWTCLLQGHDPNATGSFIHMISI